MASLHQRVGSTSTRITMDPLLDFDLKDSNSALANSASARRYGYRRSSSRPQSGGSRSGSDTSGSSYSDKDTRAEPRRSMLIRLTRRQIILLLGSLLAFIWVVQRAHSSTSTAPSKPTSSKKANTKKLKNPFTPQGIPIADRKIVNNRIRRIEEDQGHVFEDELEARNAGREPVRYDPRTRPVIFEMPDGKPRSRSKMSEVEYNEAMRVASLVDSATLDVEYCPEQLGSSGAEAAGNGARGCKFLVPAWIGEQETKAQQHLYQLGLLSLALNRTLVLPNVSKSRLTTCGAQPFEFYYAPDALAQLGVRSISYKRFTEWTAQREQRPSAQVIAVTNNAGTGQEGDTKLQDGALELDTQGDPMLVPTNPKRKLCLDPPNVFLNYSSYSPMTVHPPAGWHKTLESRFEFGGSLVNTLSSLEVLRKAYRAPAPDPDVSTGSQRIFRWFGGSSINSVSESLESPDVLVMNYELRYPILHHDQINALTTSAPGSLTPDAPSGSSTDLTAASVRLFEHFAYSNIWTDLADQVAKQLTPFIAIHWRQETLPSSIISPCGDALVNKLVELLSSSNTDESSTVSAPNDVRQDYSAIKTVYLATDYPTEDLENGRDGAVAHSGTFGKLLTEEHHIAMRRFLKLFRERLTEPLGVRLTTFSKEQSNLDLPAELTQAIPSSSINQPAKRSIWRNGRPKPRSITTSSKRSLAAEFNLADIDVGLLGIVDKAVAINAEIFLTGQPWSNSAKEVQETACAKESSFTKQISEARRRVRSGMSLVSSKGGDEQSTRQLWNDVEYWARTRSAEQVETV